MCACLLQWLCMSLTARMHHIFYDVGTTAFSRVNNFLALLTLISVLSIILETAPGLSKYNSVFITIEYVSVFFFTLEYIGRIMAQRRDFASYVFSFFGIIDLLSIVPTYLGLTNLTFLKTTRILRILRLLRMVRLAKIARLPKLKQRDLEDYSYLYRLNISIYFFALFAATTIFGTAIYILEGDNPTFSSIPLGMLWAVKPLLGGVAQTLPATIPGEMVAVLARFTGLALFGLLIAIVGNAVRRLLFGTEAIENPVSHHLKH